MEEKLNLILEKLEELAGSQKELKLSQVELKAGQAELKASHEELKIMVKSTQEAQEKAYAELVAFRNEANERFDHLERQNKFFDSDLNDLTQQVAVNKREIEKRKFQKN